MPIQSQEDAVSDTIVHFSFNNVSFNWVQVKVSAALFHTVLHFDKRNLIMMAIKVRYITIYIKHKNVHL